MLKRFSGPIGRTLVIDAFFLTGNGFCRRFARKITVKPLDRKIRVGAVSYLNTRPLLYGIAHEAVKSRMDLILDYPSALARMLLEDEIDVGLIPVAILPNLKEHHLISDYCIGSRGKVTSVGIFSERPLTEIRTVLLDYQSRTSVALARILLKEYWNSTAVCEDTQGEEYLHRIGGDVAGLVIGDRALDLVKTSTYQYDLGEAWKLHTGLDFVFAAWVSNKPIDPVFIKEFNSANALGLDRLEEVIRSTGETRHDLHQYYTRHISYLLDADKKAGMELFLQKVRTFSEHA
jgi:chorismate dehydratase